MENLHKVLKLNFRSFVQNFFFNPQTQNFAFIFPFSLACVHLIQKRMLWAPPSHNSQTSLPTRIPANFLQNETTGRGNPLASVSQVLGLQKLATMLRCRFFNASNFELCFISARPPIYSYYGFPITNALKHVGLYLSRQDQVPHTTKCPLFRFLHTYSF